MLPKITATGACAHQNRQTFRYYNRLAKFNKYDITLLDHKRLSGQHRKRFDTDFYNKVIKSLWTKHYFNIAIIATRRLIDRYNVNPQSMSSGISIAA